MASTTFPNSTIYDLPSFDMIAGSDQVLVFSVYTSGCVAQSLNGMTATWSLANYGSSVASIIKAQSLSGSSNSFTVKLLGSETSGSQGKFIQQYSLLDSSGSTMRPSQGIVSILTGY